MNSQHNTTWVKAVEVNPLQMKRLQVRLKNDQELTLNLESLIHSRDIFWRLRQDRYFKQVGIDQFGCICWPEGEDLAPDGLERYKSE